MTILLVIAISLIIISILIAFIRFIKGPGITDRILSVDTISIIVTSLLVLLALWFKRGVYIDVAIIFGVVGFMEVLIIAKFLEKGSKK